MIEHRSRDANLYCLCDQDDVWHKNKLKCVVERYNEIEDEHPVLIHSDLSLIDAKGKLLKESHNNLINNQKNCINKNTALYSNPVPGCAMTINSALADKFTYSKYMVMHDWWILLSAMYTNTNLIYINFPLVKYRQHSGNTLGYKKINITKHSILFLKKSEFSKKVIFGCRTVSQFKRIEKIINSHEQMSNEEFANIKKIYLKKIKKQNLY